MTINCFVPYQNCSQAKDTIHALKQSPLVHKIYLLVKQDIHDVIDGCEVVHADTLHATATVKAIAEHADAPYSLIYTKTSELSLGYFALERMLQIAENTGAGMVYSDHYRV